MKKFILSFGMFFLTIIINGCSISDLVSKPQIENPKENFAISGRAKIVFSRDMDKESVEENIIIEPKVEGELIWIDDQNLVFDLDDPSKVEKIDMIFSREIQDKLGQSLENPQKITFSISDKIPNLTLRTPPNQVRGIVGKTPITFLWDGPLFPLERADKWQNILEKEIKMTPFIDGKWSVLGTSGLIFEPRENWPYSTEVKVILPDSLVNTKVEHSFQTPRLELNNVFHKNLINFEPVNLQFNQPINLIEMRKKISILPDLDFDLEYGEKIIYEKEKEKKEVDLTILKIIPGKSWPADTNFEIIIPAGTSAEQGELAIESDISRDFHTITGFEVKKFDVPANSFNSFSLEFSHEVNSKEFAKYLKIYPEPAEGVWENYLKRFTDNDYKSRWFYLDPIGEYWISNERYTVVIKEGLHDVYERELKTEFKADFSTTFSERLMKIFFPTRDTVFSPETPLKFVFKYTGKARELLVSMTNILENNKKEETKKVIQLEDATAIEKTLEIDLKEKFAEFFPEGKLNTGKYSFKIWNDYQRWAQMNTIFYSSDFAVVIKEFADSRYEISAEEFSGEKISGPVKIKTFSYDGDLLESRENLELPVILDLGILSDLQITLPDGRRGFGSLQMNKKMYPEDAKINFSPWSYGDNISSVVMTDRPLFRPGDTVLFKSIFREKQNFGKNFPLKNIESDKKVPVKISIKNPFWEEVYTTKISAKNGELDGSWEIPKDAPLGSYQVEVSFMANEKENREWTESVSFHVQKFRKPKFLISANFNQPQAVYGDYISAEIFAEFAFGGALSNKKLNYTVTLFGETKDCWWWCDKRDKVLKSGVGVLNKDGKFSVPINLNFEQEKDEEINWNLVTVNATIYASNDEVSSIEKSIPFFASERILSLDWGNYFYPPNTEIIQKGAVTDLEKQGIEQDLSVEFFREKWVRNDRKGVDGDFYGDWKRNDERIWSKSITSDEHGKFSLEMISPEKAGNYFLRFIAEDDKSREITAERYFWISGKDVEEVRKNDQNRILSLFSDKESYEIGENVEVFFPLSGFEISRDSVRATIERGEVLEEIPVNFENNTLSFKTEKWMAPNVYISLLLTGKDESGERDVRWGSLKIPVSDSSRKLEISVEPLQKTYRPGEDISLKIISKINGNPAKSSVTLAVVDETLLALKSRAKIDLWQKFLAEIPLGVTTFHSLSSYISSKEMADILSQIEKIKARLALGHGGGGAEMVMADAMRKGGGAIKPRGDFKDTAKFFSQIEIDERGEKIVTFKAPDNLTKWNIWAIGHTADNAFGQTENQVQVTLPLLISEIVPQAFQMGDEISVGLLIHRNIKTENPVKISVKLNIPSQFSAEVTEKEIEVLEEARVFFPIKIPVENFDLSKDLGEMKIGFEIKSEDGLTDAVEISRKIIPPKISISAADFFHIKNAQKLDIFPDLINSLSSKILIKISASVASKLENLVNITQKTNYGCAEQRMSKSTAMLLQKEFDNVFSRDSVEINLDILKEDRDYIESAFIDGGFGYWKNSYNPSVWVTANILEYANLWENFEVPFSAKKLSEASKYLHREILQTCKEKAWHCISDSTRNYAAAVLANSGKLIVADLDFLSSYTDSFEAKIWWIKSARILGNISPKAEEIRGKLWEEIQTNLKARDRYVFFEESNRSFYSQNERLTAIIFNELVETEKWTEFYPKIAEYLANSKAKNLSGNSAMRILEVLKKYAETKELQNVGAEFLVQDPAKKLELFAGKIDKIDEIKKIEIIPDKEFSGLELFTKNEKSFYADIELREIFPVDKLLPVSKGFFIERGIYDLSDTEMENPITKLEIGKTYVSRLRIITNTSHRQIALVDYAPAGAEFVNFNFENTDKTLQNIVENEKCWGWCRPNFDHQEFHETSVRFFTDYLSAGTHEIKYLIRARMEGDFAVSPAKIEEMYYPEVFATTEGKRIQIK